MPAKKTPKKTAQSPTCTECGTNPVDQPGDRCDTCRAEEPRIIHELVLRRMEQLGLAVQDDAVDSFNDCVFHYLETHNDPELASKVRTSKYPDAPFTKHALVWWFRENKIDTVWWPAFATWLGIPDPVEFFQFMGYVRLRDWQRAAVLRDRWFASREPTGDQRARYERLIAALEATMT